MELLTFNLSSTAKLKTCFSIEIGGNAVQGTRYKVQGTNETYKAYRRETLF